MSALSVLGSVDWPNIVATLAAAVLGGWIATRIAQRQIAASQKVEADKIRRELAREWIETVDSYLHIAYRSERMQRQLLRRRMLSLTALVMPQRFDAVQAHLDGVEQWSRARQFNLPRPSGLGYSATEAFFVDLKEALFGEAFGVQFKLTHQSDPEQV